jgi:pimeloyl-ACP methyl ester carboxylesterase
LHQKEFVLSHSLFKIATHIAAQIAGILPLGTSMDAETDRTRSLGCWDVSSVTPLIQSLNTPNESYEPPHEFCDFSVSSGFGADCPQDTRTLWTEKIKQNYAGDAGRKRLREAAVNLRDRDGLHGRLVNIKCPVLWLHGDADVVYTVQNAQEEVKMLESSSDAKLVVVKGGHHYLSYTNPKEVDAALLEFVVKNSQGMKTDARALREAVGMVDI